MAVKRGKRKGEILRFNRGQYKCPGALHFVQMMQQKFDGRQLKGERSGVVWWDGIEVAGKTSSRRKIFQS